MATSYIIVSIGGGILFAIMDAAINANPLAQKLYQVYKPIAKTSLNPILGMVIDLVFGFIMAGIFWLLYPGLPGGAGVLKGLSFGGMMWFFRILMQAASQWMMFRVPGRTLVYTVFAGLGEMLVLGALYGLTLRPAM